MVGKRTYYIGSPNGVILCVDKRLNGETIGRIYHAYSKEAIHISGMEEMIVYLEGFFDRLGFPFPGTDEKTFRISGKKTEREERMIKVMREEDILENHGDAGTFIIRVQHRQHSSWQGLITWVDEDKTVAFRSALELIKLIDEALNDKDDESGNETFVKS